jgi:hypothetical protein
MAKIKFEDLPKDLKISEKELRQVMGGKMAPYTHKYGGWGMFLDVFRYATQPWTFVTDAYDEATEEGGGGSGGSSSKKIPFAKHLL